eukprot:TRINITY_DN1160_c0_g4_i4.p1 TRINITY_DN1160_c0_g4~~TRINITY_DN1160_c0_g4_i4.p1  ORF type:complete len:483 (-),score=75.17 TRINITY_DN1160_c0_g4_i4:354-1802(-)
MSSFIWRKEKPSGGLHFPASREGHSLTYIHNASILLIFGGVVSNKSTDLYVYDLTHNQWKIQQTTGRPPSARSYHSAFYDEPYFFIYAGQGDRGRSLGDFYVLNAKTWVWKKLFMLETPHFRHHHSINDMRIQEKLVFGGICSPDGTLLNDLWTVNYSNVAFGSNLSEIPGAVWTQLKPKGEIPEGRCGHNAITLNRGLMIYGGKIANEKEDPADLFYLNYDNLTWKKITSLGKIPSPRAYATMAQLDPDRLFLFGGYDLKTNRAINESLILSTKDYYWSVPFIAGYQPQPRYNHAACAISSFGRENAIFILGGIENSFLQMDFYILDTQESLIGAEWEEAKEPSEMDKLTSDIASATILDQKKYMHSLDQQFNQERLACLQLDQEIKALEEDLKNANQVIEQEMAKQVAVMKDVDEEYTKNMKLVESLFLLVKTEQLLTREQENKIGLLENFIRDSHGCVIAFDKVFNPTTMQTKPLTSNY